MPIDDRDHLRHCILYEYQQGHKVCVAIENLCRTFGEDAVTRSTVHRWYARFREGDFSLKDVLKGPRVGRPAARLKELVQKALEQDPTQKLKTEGLEKLNIQL